jgi:hypothetical protein
VYEKVLDKDNKIVKPDYEEVSGDAAKHYVDNSVLKKTYNLFPQWVIDTQVISKEESLPLTVLTKINYGEYVPIYNDGAEKIRAVSVRESNYFNNLQAIAETFE